MVAETFSEFQDSDIETSKNAFQNIIFKKQLSFRLMYQKGVFKLHKAYSGLY